MLRFVYFDIPKTVTALLHNISNILLIFGSYSHHCCNNDASTYCSNRFVTIKHNIDVCNIMLLSFVPLLIIHEPLLCAEHHPFLLCSLFPQHPYPSCEKSEIEIVYGKRYTSIVISNKPVDFISFFFIPFSVHCKVCAASVWYTFEQCLFHLIQFEMMAAYIIEDFGSITNSTYPWNQTNKCWRLDLSLWKVRCALCWGSCNKITLILELATTNKTHNHFKHLQLNASWPLLHLNSPFRILYAEWHKIRFYPFPLRFLLLLLFIYCLCCWVRVDIVDFFGPDSIQWNSAQDDIRKSNYLR